MIKILLTLFRILLLKLFHEYVGRDAEGAFRAGKETGVDL